LLENEDSSLTIIQKQEDVDLNLTALPFSVDADKIEAKRMTLLCHVPLFYMNIRRSKFTFCVL
jgi:hypothetical protein